MAFGARDGVSTTHADANGDGLAESESTLLALGLVLGPCFEAMARYWTTVLNTESGDEESRELDVVVSMDDATEPSNRSVIALGEAKVGETITLRHVSRLEDARTALGSRANAAKLLIFGSTFDDAVLHAAASRSELELVDLHRLYNGRNELARSPIQP